MKNTTFLKTFFVKREFRRWVSPVGCLLFLLMGQMAFAQFPAPYCGINFSNNVEPITLVNMGTINNATQAAVGSANSPALEDFLAMSTSVTPTVPTQITVKGNTDGNFQASIRVFVDWNQDNDFTDAGEFYNIGTFTNSTGLDDKQAVGAITPPLDALPGTTRMRVTKKYNAYVTDPCQSTFSGYGQAEDYTLTVTAPPTCLGVSGLALETNGSSSATISWDPSTSTPTGGYDYYWSETNTPPTTDTEPSGSVAAGVTEASISGLNSITQHYFWVRANCGDGDFSAWSAAFSFTTLCGVYMPSAEIENFSTFTGAMPNPQCWSEGTGALASTPLTLTGTTSDWVSENYANSGTNPNGTAARVNLYGGINFWMVSKAFDLGDGSSDYQLEYSALVIPWSGSALVTNMDEKFVKVVVSTDGGATWSEANVIKTYDNTNIPSATVNEVIVLEGYTGVVKIGFYAHSVDTAEDLRFYIDNFRIREVPSCSAPTALELEEVGETTATISWTESVTVPEEGYQYYRSETNTAPEESTEPTGEVGAGVLEAELTGMTVSTTYYVWFRAECEPGLYSEWVGPVSFGTLCDSADILSTEGDSVCGQGMAELSATVSEDGVLKWYAAETGGAALGTGTTFTTPLVTETTNFYVSGGNINADMDVTVGAGASTSTSGGYSPFYHGWGGVKTQFIITAAEMQMAGIYAGPINSVAFTVTGLGTSYEDFAVSIGTTTQNAATTTHIDGLTPVYSSPAYTPTMGLNVFEFTTPFVWDGTSNIVVQTCYHDVDNPTGGTSATVQYDTTSYVASTYTYADNQSAAAVCAATTGSVGGSGGTSTQSARAKMTFNATAICESARVMVTAEVTDAPDIEVEATEMVICNGDSTDLSVESENADYTYMWMPGELEGADQTVSPTETTTYIVTATDEETGCVETAEITITVNALPDAVTITPSTEDVCQNSVVQLTVSEPEMPEYCVPTVVEDGSTGDYINNFSFADIVNNGSGDTAEDYVYYEDITANVVGGETYDVSLQGGSATWAQQFRIWIDFNHDGEFTADESVFNTTTSSTAVVTGTITIPLTAINGMTRMRVGDRFSTGLTADEACANPGFGEYEDYNINITGATEALAYSWSPATGLFVNEDATEAYTGQSVTSVYYYADEDATFNVTVTNGNGCSVSASADVEIIVIPAPEAPAAQTLCGGSTVADLTSEAEIMHWYYAPAGGSEIAPATILLDNTTYYVAQTVDGCESVARTMVSVTVNTIDAPTIEEEIVTFCNEATLADIEMDGEGILWYTSATGGDALEADTEIAEGISIFFASQTVDGCESTMRTAVVTELNVTVAPDADEAQTFCNAATVADLMAEGEMIMWYDAEDNMLTAETALTNGGVYYASQTVNGCESSEMAMVTVTINAPTAPTGDADQEVCEGSTLADLTLDNEMLTWYDALEGGNMLEADTALTNGGIYYASQWVDGCESIGRYGVTATMITVTVDTPADVTECDSYVLPALTNGAYYTETNGGGEAVTAGTEIMQNTTLYVYATGGTEATCSAEHMFTITISPAAAPSGEANQSVEIHVGEEATIADLVVTTEGEGTVTWYASEEDAANGTNALSMDTVITDGSTYYATFTSGDCTSGTFGVTVDVVLGNHGFDRAAFTYHPNPVRNVLNIAYSSEITSVTVFNLLGQQVIAQQPNATEVKVDMSGLADGTYVINVTSGNAVNTFKVVKHNN